MQPCKSVFGRLLRCHNNNVRTVSTWFEGADPLCPCVFLLTANDLLAGNIDRRMDLGTEQKHNRRAEKVAKGTRTGEQ